MVPYTDLMQQPQERFGARDLPARTQGRFQVAHQETGQSLDDCSDRVLTLATKAFRDPPPQTPMSRQWRGFARD
ncbi:hypothetical protein DPMN_160269 [Dreissena polymorpha]|uniref:Uncharacterized protein n=1 Tax=Dreissena polymorpha TaxID=45954 RepID=A0A9D4EMW2_DREPO|nr:hypothetical protein DPMN_160269 [Dreissena polymorpha]